MCVLSPQCVSAAMRDAEAAALVHSARRGRRRHCLGRLPARHLMRLCGYSSMRVAAGLGLPEKQEDESVVSKKVLKLAELIRNAKSCVMLTGAGISTSAGVSDFRGPNGVWTAEKKGVVPPASKSFENVQPTLAVSRATACCVASRVLGWATDVHAALSAHGNGRNGQSRIHQARHFPGFCLLPP